MQQMQHCIDAKKPRRTTKQEKTGPSALPKLILQIIPAWISKLLLMVFTYYVN
jgi:hypothetical protein